MLTPIGTRILIKAVEMKAGTLLLTNVKASQYEVIAIGDEITRIKPGNIVYLDRHQGIEIEHEKQKFLVIDESSILVIVSQDIL